MLSPRRRLTVSGSPSPSSVHGPCEAFDGERARLDVELSRTGSRREGRAQASGEATPGSRPASHTMACLRTAARLADRVDARLIDLVGSLAIERARAARIRPHFRERDLVRRTLLQQQLAAAEETTGSTNSLPTRNLWTLYLLSYPVISSL